MSTLNWDLDEAMPALLVASPVLTPTRNCLSLSLGAGQGGTQFLSLVCRVKVRIFLPVQYRSGSTVSISKLKVVYKPGIHSCSCAAVQVAYEVQSVLSVPATLLHSSMTHA
jgi:hypothetical protein